MDRNVVGLRILSAVRCNWLIGLHLRFRIWYKQRLRSLQAPRHRLPCLVSAAFLSAATTHRTRNLYNSSPSSRTSVHSMGHEAPQESGWVAWQSAALFPRTYQGVLGLPVSDAPSKHPASPTMMPYSHYHFSSVCLSPFHHRSHLRTCDSQGPDVYALGDESYAAVQWICASTVDHPDAG